MRLIRSMALAGAITLCLAVGAAIRCNSFACNASMTPRWTKDVVGSAKGNPDFRFALAKADCTKRWNGRAALAKGGA